jgi:PPOX class probable F420-dependent enzyme
VTSELERAVRSHKQWFGSYKKSGELKKVPVWLVVNNGRIEFTTQTASYKVKRVRRNPRVICFIGSEEGPAIRGTAEIVTDKDAVWRGYRASWKTHPLLMLILAFGIRRRIKKGESILIRVHPDEPNPLARVTDPQL